jgi:hypothetical protein
VPADGVSAVLAGGVSAVLAGGVSAVLAGGVSAVLAGASPCSAFGAAGASEVAFTAVSWSTAGATAGSSKRPLKLLMTMAAITIVKPINPISRGLLGICNTSYNPHVDLTYSGTNLLSPTTAFQLTW